jgi:hypothetical protein
MGNTDFGRLGPFSFCCSVRCGLLTIAVVSLYWKSLRQWLLRLLRFIIQILTTKGVVLHWHCSLQVSVCLQRSVGGLPASTARIHSGTLSTLLTELRWQVRNDKFTVLMVDKQLNFLEPWIVFVCSKLDGISYETGFLLGGERWVVLFNQSLDFGHFPLPF